MTWTVTDTNRDKSKEVDSRSEAEERKNDLVSLGANPEDIEIKPPEDGTETTVADPASVKEEVVAEEANNVDDYSDELPDKPPVDTDPLTWIPDEFQDTIDGTIAINRKGFEVLAHHYNISCETDMVQYRDGTCIHKAEARTENGTVYGAYGEAHATEDNDTQLVRLSDTRAFKRAVSRATGIGMIAVEELQSEL